MIRRLLSYFLSLVLLILPATVLFLISSEAGTQHLAKLLEKTTNVSISEPKGTVLSGQLQFAHITHPTFEAKEVKIKISRNTQYPFFEINTVNIDELTTAPAFNTGKHSKQFLPIPQSVNINTLKINNLLSNPIAIKQVKFTHSDNATILQINWHGKPLQLELEKEEITESKSEIKFTAKYEDTELSIYGQKTPQQLHFQSPPSEPGHLVFYHHTQNDQWTLDVDYQLNLTDQLAIKTKLTANWNHNSGNLLINEIKITDQAKETHIDGTANASPKSIAVNLKTRHRDNAGTLKGSCTDHCDLTLTYQLDNLEQISSNLAGDAKGSAHIFGPKENPDIHIRHHSKYLRHRLLSFNNLDVSFEKDGKQSDLKIDASDIGSANTLFEQPFTLHARGISKRILGNIILLGKKIHFAGNLEKNSSLRIYKENLPEPYQLSNDLIISYNKQSFNLNLHPTCLKFADNQICATARLGPKQSFLDFDQINLSGQITLPLSDKTSFLHISSYQINGNFSLDFSDTLTLKSNLKIDTGKGFLANIVPSFFIPINYQFDKITLHSSGTDNELSGKIYSPEGDTMINLQADEDISGLSLNVTTPKIILTHHKHKISGSQSVSCKINTQATNCSLKALLEDSRLKFLALTPTTELPSDIVIDTPVQIKHSSEYAFDMSYNITLGKNNSLDIAGFSGPLIGSLTIKSPHTQPATASGLIEIKPAIFSLFGKTIQLQQAQMVYHNDPIDAPMFNLHASKNVHTANAQLTTVSLSMFGRTKDFQVDLKSVPIPMSQLEMLSNLFSSKNVKDWHPEQDKLVLSMLQRTGSGSGVLSLLKTLSDFERGLNIDSVEINPQFSVTNDITAPKITLKKSLFDKTYLKYQFLLHDNRNGTLSLVYQLPRNLFFELFLNRENQGINLLYQSQ